MVLDLLGSAVTNYTPNHNTGAWIQNQLKRFYLGSNWGCRSLLRGARGPPTVNYEKCVSLEGFSGILCHIFESVHPITAMCWS